MNKKADFKMVDFFRIAVMLGIAVFIYLLMSQNSNTDLKNDKLGYIILDQMSYNSVSGFSYVDSNNRIHPGIVDLQKFSQDRIGDFISIPMRGGIKFTLNSLNGKISKEVYLNKDDFSFSSGFSSGFFNKKKIDLVTIKYGENFIPGSLEAHYAFQ